MAAAINSCLKKYLSCLGTNLSQVPNLELPQWPRENGIADELRNQPAEVEAMVEPVREGAEVLVGVHAELEGLVRTGDRGLEVTEHRIDPVECRQPAWLAPSRDNVRMRTARIEDAREAVQPVAQDAALPAATQHWP